MKKYISVLFLFVCIVQFAQAQVDDKLYQKGLKFCFERSLLRVSRQDSGPPGDLNYFAIIAQESALRDQKQSCQYILNLNIFPSSWGENYIHRDRAQMPHHSIISGGNKLVPGKDALLKKG